MDDLEDYDFPDIDISLQEIQEPTKSTKPTESRGTRKKDSLGIDDEVRVKKKRVNIKLDETRSLQLLLIHTRLQLNVFIDFSPRAVSQNFGGMRPI
jgi:hypothetical protein